MNDKYKFLIDNLKTICSVTDVYIGKNNNSNIKKILGLLILERINWNLHSILCLLENNPKVKNIEPSIGLILRNNLSLSSIVFEYSELEEKKLNLEQFYKNIFGENIQKTIKSLEKEYSSDLIKNEIDKIKLNYGLLLSQINLDLDNIRNEKFKKRTLQPSNLNNLYLSYSKYEHFGLNTLILQDSDDYDKYERIKIGIHYSLQGVLICLLMLDISDHQLMDINKIFSINAK